MVFLMVTGESSEMRQQISRKKTEELADILKALILRYEELYPDYELVCLFLPKYDPEERKRLLSQMERFCHPQTEGYVIDTNSVGAGF